MRPPDPIRHTAGAHHHAVEAIVRESYGRLVALLAARTGDLHAAEDALADALLAALRAWPRDGVPDNPEGWLVVAARRKSIDAHRKHTRTRAGIAIDELLLAMPEDPLLVSIPDERLRLLFACAHPAIDPRIRSPLLLQCVLGYDTATIAARFVTGHDAMKKRLTRAKAKIREASIRFEEPESDERLARIDDVLDAVYASFGIAHDSTQLPLSLQDDALLGASSLARAVAELLPDHGEALGLWALVAFCLARSRARRTADRGYLPLDQQDPARWDQSLIDAAEAHLRVAASLGAPGRYQIEAAIQSAHVHRVRDGDNTWPTVVGLYDLLIAIAPTVGAAVGRAAALAEAVSPDAGLRALSELPHERVAVYQPYHAVRAALLAKAGHDAQALDAFTTAIGLTTDPAVRAYLIGRASQLPGFTPTRS